MKCANCGNNDQKTLWDEGDTFYCSKCYFYGMKGIHFIAQNAIIER